MFMTLMAPVLYCEPGSRPQAASYMAKLCLAHMPRTMMYMYMYTVKVYMYFVQNDKHA